ncbi:hypothetical protein LAZ40_06335 [Cereibacter sphaeroides]|uniref:hypothetical protein n=1 Tax=Cereibacter sphaeroides TaxID=1063 RepID=UPI001F1C0164|nr:hypothetical protein [Cereibacter sphaeroides]MCE6958665.1 hypothetical protein [Cereibacter sphaeroides]MCE6973452.1 hypothetical protein [Cereibacter sphaeroides]
MSLDPSTEAISRFIGSFHLELEAERMRSDYEAFRAAGKLAEEAPQEPVPFPALSAPHELQDFVPGLKYAPAVPAAAPEPVEPAETPPAPVEPIAPDLLLPLREAALPAVQGSGGEVAEGLPVLVPPPPNTILTVTVQVADLSDNDLLDFGTPDVFLPVGLQMATLEALAGAAAALGADVDAGLPAHAVPTLADAGAMAARMIATGEAPAAPGVTEVTLHGAEALGIHVVGAPAGVLPDFLDLLPEALRPAEEETAPTGGGGAGDPASDPRLDPGGSSAGPFSDMEVEPGHAVGTGANLAVNETLITLRWVDAPVIAVGGTVVELAAISQTNVMVSSALPGTAPSGQAINAAAIEQFSSGGAGTAAPGSGAPEDWRIVTIDGDLTAMNWVQQYVFLGDMDRAEVIFTGSSTWMGLGGNIVSNQAAIVELGFHYDLIVVEGDMLSLTSISQTNVLLDSDIVTGAPAGTVTAQDNLQLNSARITQSGIDTVTEMTAGIRDTLEAMAAGGGPGAAILDDPAFAGLDGLDVLYVRGNFTKLNVIEQVNVLGDSDQLHLACEGLAAAGGQIGIVTGSNAQANLAHVFDDGLDSTVMAAGGGYSDALIHQAGLIDLDAPPGGVALAPVVSEAVAFLAEGMIDPVPDLEIAPVPGLPDLPGSLDVMQTALA